MEKSFSGRFVVRMPTDLHAHLSELAEKNGVSLNTMIVAYLAGASRFKAEADPTVTLRQHQAWAKAHRKP